MELMKNVDVVVTDASYGYVLDEACVFGSWIIQVGPPFVFQ